MALTTVNLTLGPRSTPQDIKEMRSEVFEFQKMYGSPVIHKHRWNSRDAKNGLTQVCPYHYNVAYGQSDENCPYCFGTGYLGGFADGQIVYMTFADAAENRIHIGPQGVLLFDQQPDIVAPWTPDLGTGDLIITADFSPNTFTILEEHDRFILKDVQPRTVRGFQEKVQTIEYKVQQNVQADRVPDDDLFQNVPIVFEYDNLPPIPDVPEGGDPNDYPYTFTSTDIGLSVYGLSPTGDDSIEIGLAVIGLGEYDTSERSLALVGIEPNDVVQFVFEDD